MNKKIILVVILIVILYGVFWLLDQKKEIDKVGAAKDSHGCLTSAGFQYSKIKDACAQIFTEGIRLSPAKKGTDPTVNAFVFFKNRESDIQTEVFLPSAQESIILTRERNNYSLWKNDKYSLRKMESNYILIDSQNETLYQRFLK